MLRINDVVSFGDSKFRILENTGDHYVWIDIESDNPFPEQISTAEVERAIHAESLKRVDDPYGFLVTRSPEEGSTDQQIRDKRYAIIDGLASNPAIFQRKGRGALIQKIVEETGTPKKTIYSYLRQYWQRGCTPNALIPDYENSGGRGKRRVANKAKLGRPRVITSGKGALVDASTERMFRIVLDRHFLNEKKNSMLFAHRRFEDMYEAANPNVPKEDYPTITQLRYFYEREYMKPERIQLRSNRIEYDLNVRPLTGTATAGTHGPGARYEIDSTIADVYLLSSDRQKIVGRPTLYVVIDVFSRLITGFYVGLENPSYDTAILALYNSFTDKSLFCESIGIDIDVDDWPSVGLPDAIVADRGELLGRQIESLERGCRVRVENTPSYRGDAKGVVERQFRTIQADFKNNTPGVVSGTRAKKRGGKDYRLDATLTVDDFRKIILSSILHRNLYSVLDSYDRPPGMPDDLPAVPIKLWRWGIQQKSGRLRNYPEEDVRLALMPRTKATLSNLGIQCFGVFYTCDELNRSGWLHRTGGKRPGPFEAAYDPTSVDTIYFFPEKDRTNYWLCSLAVRSREFQGKTFWDLWASQRQQKKATAPAKQRERESKRSLENLIIATVKDAQESRPVSLGSSKADAIGGIRENRREALKSERKDRQSEPQPDVSKEEAEIIPFIKQPEDGAFPDFLEDLFGDDE